MQARQITADYTVSPQIDADDVADIAAAGFKTVICNRPDNEEPGQPEHADIAAACEENGLAFHYLPFQSAPVADEILTGFRAAVDGSDGPVFAYCRSGQRCEYIWNLAAQQQG